MPAQLWRVLIIDDEPSMREALDLIRRTEALDSITCTSLAEASSLLSQQRFDAVLADLRLSDGNAAELVQLIRQRGGWTPIVIMARRATIPLAVESMRAGADDFIEKPLAGADLAKAIRGVLAADGESAAALADGLRRWADAVCSIIDSRHDPSTLTAWARVVRVAPETLRTWCRSMRLPVKSSLDLGRLLRCLHHARKQRCRPEFLLDVAHPRTLRRLLLRGGLGLRVDPIPTVAAFLERQCLIRDASAVQELKRRLPGRVCHGVSAE